VEFSSCTAEQRKRFSSSEACGLMANTSEANPFNECVNWMRTTHEADGNSPFSSCLIDACNNEGAGLKKVICSALEEFEEQCSENGYAPLEYNDWRKIASCCKLLLRVIEYFVVFIVNKCIQIQFCLIHMDKLMFVEL
jgi:hypothetical protein